MTMDAESQFEMSGEPTPEEASLLVNRVPQDVYDEVDVKYEGGKERGREEMPVLEAERYLESVTESKEPLASAQPEEKLDDENYWTEATEDSGRDFFRTTLPNPQDLSVGDGIEAEAGYEDGQLSLYVSVDTVEGEGADAAEGNLRITYHDDFEVDVDNELERTQAVMNHFDGLGSVVE